MSLPPIAPTGAMASGDYVDYMMVYNAAAIAETAEDLEDYVTDSTIDDWGRMWVKILNDTSADLRTLETSVSKLKSQIIMVADAVKKL
jgi:hypothetical protein